MTKPDDVRRKRRLLGCEAKCPGLVLLLVTVVGCRAPQSSTVEQARQRGQELVAFNSWVERGWSSASWVPPGSAPDDYTRQPVRQQADQLVKR